MEVRERYGLQQDLHGRQAVIGKLAELRLEAVEDAQHRHCGEHAVKGMVA